MTSVALRCSTQPDDTRPGRGAAAAPGAASPARRYRCEATLGGGVSAGVTVSFSPGAIASAAQLLQSAAHLGGEGVQLVGDAVKATADLAGDVLEHGVIAGVAGAALIGALV